LLRVGRAAWKPTLATEQGAMLLLYLLKVIRRQSTVIL